jgi:hypothetical protein
VWVQSASVGMVAMASSCVRSLSRSTRFYRIALVCRMVVYPFYGTSPKYALELSCVAAHVFTRPVRVSYSPTLCLLW